MAYIDTSISYIKGQQLWTLYLTDEQEDILDYILWYYKNSEIYPFFIVYDNVTLYMLESINALHKEGMTLYMACRIILGTNYQIYERT